MPKLCKDQFLASSSHFLYEVAISLSLACHVYLLPWCPFSIQVYRSNVEHCNQVYHSNVHAPASIFLVSNNEDVYLPSNDLTE